ncbi:MAG: oligosaccharide flippase family protein [Paludibacteraceae bacterium]|nr:oligosaccharide flippase family protein [Paludibacteraceae bacterium]
MSEMVLFTFQSILSTTYNLFAHIQDQQERIRRIFRLMVKLTSLITIPVMMVLIASAEPLFYTLFGEKWMDSVPYFQWICAANLWSTIYLINNHALNSVGKSHISFRIELLKRGLTLATLVAALYWNHLHPEAGIGTQITRVLMGYAFACTAAWLLSMWCIKRHFAISGLEQVDDLLPAVGLGFLLAASCYGLGCLTTNLYIRCIVELGAAVVLYIGLLRILSPSTWIRIVNYLKNRQLRS